MKLTAAQAICVQRMGQDVCVEAGPGSGKTFVLVERFAWLVEQCGVSPLRILAITFTEKAANELKSRLVQRFSTDPKLRRQLERAWISTVHSFCARLLREQAIHAGLDPEFAILDEPASDRLLEQASEEALEQLHCTRPDEFARVLESLYVSTWRGGQQPDLAAALRQIYAAVRVANLDFAELRSLTLRYVASPVDLAGTLSSIRSLMPSPSTLRGVRQREFVIKLDSWLASFPPCGDAVQLAEVDVGRLLASFPFEECKKVRDGSLQNLADAATQLASLLATRFYQPLRLFLLDALELVDSLYRQHKQRIGGLDFTDLEEQALKLLQSGGPVARRIRASFDYILMDEVQDTNRLQWRLLEQLRQPGRFFGVGDINQSIYGFRHADPYLFESFRKSLQEAGEVVDFLPENFRSRPEILAFVEFLLGGVSGIRPRRLDPKRSFPLKTIPSVELLFACAQDRASSATQEAEARWVAHRIAELVGRLELADCDGRVRPCRYRDIAILVRSTGSLDGFQDALESFGIPYVAVAGSTFYETREVRDLLNFLKALAEPEDEVALAGLLRSPLAGASDETLLRTKLARDRLSALLYEPGLIDTFPLDEEEKDSLARFVQLFRRFRARLDTVSPDRLLAEAMDAFDYESRLSSRARANITKFLSQLREIYQAQPQSLASLVDWIEHLRAHAAEPEAPPDDTSDAVRLMTIHRAKGLEFPVVFVSALQRKTRTDYPVVCFSSEAGLGVRWRVPESHGSVEDLPYQEALAITSAAEHEEEHRLLYVAMTRAGQHLVLSSVSKKGPTGPGHKILLDKLRPYVDPIPEGSIREIALESAGLTIRVHKATGLPPAPEILATPETTGQRTVKLVPRPPLASQHEGSASVTSVQLFALCPYRYYLTHYLPAASATPMRLPLDPEDVFLQEPGRGELDAVELGSLVHDILAGKPVQSAPPEALELVERFQRSPVAGRAAKASRVGRETPFVMAVGDVVLHGQIDLWFEDDTSLVLVDYKTDRIDRDAVPERAQDYLVQLRLYALALEHLHGRLPTEAVLYFLVPDVVMAVSLDPEELEAALSWVKALSEAQASLTFEPAPGPRCTSCPVLDRCPAGQTRY